MTYVKRASRCRREEVTLLLAAFAMDVERFSVEDFLGRPRPPTGFCCFGGVVDIVVFKQDRVVHRDCRAT